MVFILPAEDSPSRKPLKTRNNKPTDFLEILEQQRTMTFEEFDHGFCKSGTVDRNFVVRTMSGEQGIPALPHIFKIVRYRGYQLHGLAQGRQRVQLVGRQLKNDAADLEMDVFFGANPQAERLGTRFPHSVHTGFLLSQTEAVDKDAPRGRAGTPLGATAGRRVSR